MALRFRRGDGVEFEILDDTFDPDHDYAFDLDSHGRMTNARGLFTVHVFDDDEDSPTAEWKEDVYHAYVKRAMDRGVLFYGKNHIQHMIKHFFKLFLEDMKKYKSRHFK
jgi:hypothetical protein